MSWKNILPKEIDVGSLSLEDSRNFKEFFELLKSIKSDVKGPLGYRIFNQIMHYLLFYGICCVEENKFPALSKCWNELSPLFLKSEYDCEWLVHSWIFCDFPIERNKEDVLLDHFAIFIQEQPELPDNLKGHVKQFYLIMKASRLGLYQEVLSTSKVTKYRELFTNKSISTVRSIPDYESGEIFLTRIISYLGDSFAIHDSKSYPAEVKEMLENMVREKMHFISHTKNEAANYEQFMKLAGPYWMSCTHTDQSTEILSPDAYMYYY